MSDALAMAAVTRALGDLLRTALVSHQIDRLLGAEVAVVLRPPRPDGDPEPAPRLHLFLHHVMHGAFIRQASVPAEQEAPPPMSLDLHYLVTAVTSAELQAEVLLGLTARCFEDQPVVSAEMLQTALTRSGLPGVDAALAATVAQRIEPVSVAPRAAAEAGGMRWPEGAGTTSRPALAYEARLMINAG